MKIPLSHRLQVCCSLIQPGDRVADVGTDHGYLGIWLLHAGIARSVIASDVVPGPLSAAKRNAEKFGFLDKMSFYLSDGVQNIPKDFDALVCAGMGADTMISILEQGQWLKDPRYRLVLQCQSKAPMLRSYLSREGYRIRRELVLRDGKFLYTVMEVIFEPVHPLSSAECYFSPALLENTGEELREYIWRVMEGLQQAAAHRSDPELTALLEELNRNPRIIRLKENTNGNCQ